MNSRKQNGELQATSSNGAASQPQFTSSHNTEVEVVEESSPTPFMVHVDEGSMAYEILLLQQRLEAYERLHIEELTELRTEVERLRRAFLQEMNDDLRPRNNQQTDPSSLSFSREQGVESIFLGNHAGRNHLLAKEKKSTADSKPS